MIIKKLINRRMSAFSIYLIFFFLELFSVCDFFSNRRLTSLF